MGHGQNSCFGYGLGRYLTGAGFARFLAFVKHVEWILSAFPYGSPVWAIGMFIDAVDLGTYKNGIHKSPLGPSQRGTVR